MKSISAISYISKIHDVIIYSDRHLCGSRRETLYTCEIIDFATLCNLVKTGHLKVDISCITMTCCKIDINERSTVFNYHDEIEITMRNRSTSAFKYRIH